MAKFSKLLGGDPAEFTPAQAGAAFAGEASRMVREDGISLTDAWKKAKLMHPETHARLCEGANPTATIANDGMAAKLPFVANENIPIAGKPLLLPSFYLPPLTSDEMFAAAWRANGNQGVRVDAQKVFLGLVTYVSQKQNCSVAIARSQVLDDYPQLARAAGQTPDPATPAKGRKFGG